MKFQWKMIERWGRDHLPQLLLGSAIGGAVATTGLAIYGTVKTVQKIDELEQNVKGVTPAFSGHVDTTDKVKACAKYWIAPTLMLGGTIFCICELNSVHLHKEAALAAMGAMWRGKYLDLKGEVEKHGNKSGKEIAREAMEKEVARTAQNTDRNLQLSAGEFLVYEPYSRELFKATTQQLLWAELTANKEYANQGYLSLNDFLMLFPGTKQCTFGDNFGWFPGCDTKNKVSFVKNSFIDISSSLQKIDGQECTVLQYSIPMDYFLSSKYERR